MAITYEPLATVTLSADASAVTFSNIPQNYTDLIIITSGGVVTAGSGSNTGTMQVGNNGIDTSSNYSWTNTFGDGTSPGSSRGSNQTYALLQEFPGTLNTQIRPSAGITHIMSYSNTNIYKTILSAGGGGAYVRRAASLWRSTSAITNISISSSANLASGFLVSIYGVRAA